MIEFAINIEPLYPGMDFYEKIKRVSAAGFTAVEFWGWADKDLAKIKQTCQSCGVKVRAFSGTAGYSLCDRAHQDACVDWIEKSVNAAKELDCDTLILFPNHFTPNGCADFRQQYSHSAMVANVTNALTRLVPMLEKNKATVLLEPLSNLGADAGMSVTDTAEGADIIRAVGSEHVRLLCDVYHMQVMHGNLLPNIMGNLDIVPYIHIADAPDRHEPGTGEINFDYLCREIQKSDFAGTVCLEYIPEGDTDAGFAGAKKIFEFLR